MISKFLLTGLMLTTAAPALADSGFQSTGHPASLHCVGSQGELTVEANEQLKTFELAVVLGAKTTLIEIDDIKAQPLHSTPDVRITSFTYDDPSQNFVSLDASFVAPKWFPPSDGCLPTRAPNQCVPMHNDGYWGSLSSHEVLLGFKVNPAGDGTYLLDVLRAEPYGIGGLDQMPLGEKVVCSGALL